MVVLVDLTPSSFEEPGTVTVTVPANGIITARVEGAGGGDGLGGLGGKGGYVVGTFRVSKDDTFMVQVGSQGSETAVGGSPGGGKGGTNAGGGGGYSSITLDGQPLLVAGGGGGGGANEEDIVGGDGGNGGGGDRYKNIRAADVPSGSIFPGASGRSYGGGDGGSSQGGAGGGNIPAGDPGISLHGGNGVVGGGGGGAGGYFGGGGGGRGQELILAGIPPSDPNIYNGGGGGGSSYAARAVAVESGGSVDAVANGKVTLLFAQSLALSRTGETKIPYSTGAVQYIAPATGTVNAYVWGGGGGAAGGGNGGVGGYITGQFSVTAGDAIRVSVGGGGSGSDSGGVGGSSGSSGSSGGSGGSESGGGGGGLSTVAVFNSVDQTVQSVAAGGGGGGWYGGETVTRRITTLSGGSGGREAAPSATPHGINGTNGSEITSNGGGRGGVWGTTDTGANENPSARRVSPANTVFGRGGSGGAAGTGNKFSYGGGGGGAGAGGGGAVELTKKFSNVIDGDIDLNDDGRGGGVGGGDGGRGNAGINGGGGGGGGNGGLTPGGGGGGGGASYANVRSASGTSAMAVPVGIGAGGDNGGNGGDGYVVLVYADTVVDCYAKGTKILTQNGYVKIEDINASDKVVTTSTITNNRTTSKQILQAIKQKTHFIVNTSSNKSRPICIKAHTFGQNMPFEDLFVSPGHGIQVKDKLVRARDLVNGTTITQSKKTEDVTYYHIELAKHAMVVANGIAAESYLERQKNKNRVASV